LSKFFGDCSRNRWARLRVTTAFAADLGDPQSIGAGSLRNFLRSSQRLASNGYYRSALSLELLSRFVDSIQIKVHRDLPALSSVHLSQDIALEVECLKQFVATTLTHHSRVQVAEWRAEHVIGQIFCAIKEGGRSLLPDDFATTFEECESEERFRYRVICDFIAGMTERYALEFYGRLYSDRPETLFKPL
jgi:dGTPase